LAEQRAFQRYGVSVCIFQDINPTEFLEQQESLYFVTRPFLKAQRAIENLLSMGGHYCSFHSAARLRVRLRQSLAVGGAISITCSATAIRRRRAFRCRRASRLTAFASAL
jgi:hypothetical protein